MFDSQNPRGAAAASERPNKTLGAELMFTQTHGMDQPSQRSCPAHCLTTQGKARVRMRQSFGIHKNMPAGSSPSPPC
jgi:hypothetical protein